MKSAVLVLLVLASSSGCEPQAAAEPPVTTVTATALLGRPEAIAQALGAYETMRVALAGDSTASLAGAAGRLTAAVDRARPGAAEPLAGALRTLRAGARPFIGGPDDLAAARAAFAELSRAVAALVAVDPSFARGRRLYECPAVEGYGRWVQVGEVIGNPYTGLRLPDCGAVIEWGDATED